MSRPELFVVFAIVFVCGLLAGYVVRDTRRWRRDRARMRFLRRVKALDYDRGREA